MSGSSSDVEEPSHPVATGQKLSVFWDEDKVWYDVDVKRSRAAKGGPVGCKEWLLEYDDGSQEWLRFDGPEKVLWKIKSLSKKQQRQLAKASAPPKQKKVKLPKAPKPPKPPKPPPAPKPGASLWKKSQPHLLKYFGAGSTVAVRSFERKAGGSDGVPTAGGFALGLGWKYEDKTSSLDDYEDQFWYSDKGDERQAAVPKKGQMRSRPIVVKDGRRVRRRYPAQARVDEKLPKLVERERLDLLKSASNSNDGGGSGSSSRRGGGGGGGGGSSSSRRDRSSLYCVGTDEEEMSLNFIRNSRFTNVCCGPDCKCDDAATCLCVRDGVGCHDEGDGTWCNCAPDSLCRKGKGKSKKNPHGRTFFDSDAVDKIRHETLDMANKGFESATWYTRRPQGEDEGESEDSDEDEDEDEDDDDFDDEDEEDVEDEDEDSQADEDEDEDEDEDMGEEQDEEDEEEEEHRRNIAAAKSKSISNKRKRRGGGGGRAMEVQDEASVYDDPPLDEGPEL